MVASEGAGAILRELSTEDPSGAGKGHRSRTVISVSFDLVASSYAVPRPKTPEPTMITLEGSGLAMVGMFGLGSCSCKVSLSGD